VCLSGQVTLHTLCPLQRFGPRVDLDCVPVPGMKQEFSDHPDRIAVTVVTELLYLSTWDEAVRVYLFAVIFHQIFGGWDLHEL